VMMQQPQTVVLQAYSVPHALSAMPMHAGQPHHAAAAVQLQQLPPSLPYTTGSKLVSPHAVSSDHA